MYILMYMRKIQSISQIIFLFIINTLLIVSIFSTELRYHIIIVCIIAITILIIFSIQDLRNRKYFEEKLVWLSNHDELTGIFNRRYFNNQIRLEWYRLMRTNTPLGLIMLDVDYFKEYNDTFGHQKGDQCLKLVATALNNIVNRSSDVVSRYGGEEFVILMPGTDEKGIMHIADKIQNHIRALNIKHPWHKTKGYITISMGLSVMIPISTCTEELLLKQADHALYEAKNAGKDCFKI